MSPVHGVARLEGDNLVPSVLCDFIANLDSGAEGVRKVCLEIREVQNLNRAREHSFTQALEGSYAGMIRVQSAEYFFRHEVDLLFGDRLYCIHVHYRQHRITFDIGVAQCNATSCFDTGFTGKIEDWHWKEQARTGVHVFCHRHCVCQIHIAGQWVKITTTQHYRIGCGRGVEQNRGQVFRLCF